MAVERPHRPRRGRQNHCPGRSDPPPLPGKMRRSVLLRVVLVQGLAHQECRPTRVRRRAFIHRALRLPPRSHHRQQRPRQSRPRHLRRRPQGDVQRRLGRFARYRLPRKARPCPRSTARAPLPQSPPLRPARRTPQPALGQGARLKNWHRGRRRGLRCPHGRRRRRHHRRRSGEDPRHQHLRHDDRPQRRRTRRHPRRLRHRRWLDHARVLRHRGWAVRRRRHLPVVRQPPRPRQLRHHRR